MKFIYGKFNRIIPGQYHNVGQPPQNTQNAEKPAPSTDSPVNLDNRFGEPVWDVVDVQQNDISNAGGKGKILIETEREYLFIPLT